MPNVDDGISTHSTIVGRLVFCGFIKLGALFRNSATKGLIMSVFKFKMFFWSACVLHSISNSYWTVTNLRDGNQYGAVPVTCTVRFYSR